MLRFMMALGVFALLAWLLGFGNSGVAWAGLARSLFFLYVGLLGLCALASLVSRRR